MTQETPAPAVFISYSHDTKEHKQWVLELAQRLRGERIDVIIDQWDLEFGDDVAAFMAHSVAKAQRVLMICTEAYVQKVDEGKGGVGYEALIVTGELIQNLGTKKFVPVLRQSREPILLPKKLGPRMAVNLSHYHPSTEEEFQKLVAQLRQEPPLTKPPLGEITPSSTSPLPATEQPDPSIEAAVDPAVAYGQAHRLAKVGDMSTWRRLISAHRTAASKHLLAWRKEAEKNPPQNTSELPSMLKDALVSYQPLFAAAISAIESGQPKFNQQASLVHDLVESKGWERSGMTIITSLPEAAAWVFQALAGAMHVHTGQLELALDLATQRIPERYSKNSAPLFLTHNLVGWPESLDTTCTVAWQFLNELPHHFPWITEAFGSDDDYKQALAGYYLVLSWLEYLSSLVAGQGEAMTKRALRPEIPPLFLNGESIQRGMLRVLEDRETLVRYMEKAGIQPADQKKYWPAWMDCLQAWMAKAFHHPFRFGGAHHVSHFADDIMR